KTGRSNCQRTRIQRKNRTDHFKEGVLGDGFFSIVTSERSQEAMGNPLVKMFQSYRAHSFTNALVNKRPDIGFLLIQRQQWCQGSRARTSPVSLTMSERYLLCYFASAT